MRHSNEKKTTYDVNSEQNRNSSNEDNFGKKKEKQWNVVPSLRASFKLQQLSLCRAGKGCTEQHN